MATSRRVGNYATSANAVIRNSDAIFDAAMSGKPDFTKISKEAIKGRSLERRAVTKAEADVASAGLKAFTDVNLTRMREDTKKEIADIKRPAKRMAGAVAGLGAIAGGYVMMEGNKKDKAERDELRGMRDAMSAKADLYDQQRDQRDADRITRYRNEITGASSSDAAVSNTGSSSSPVITSKASTPAATTPVAPKTSSTGPQAKASPSPGFKGFVDMASQAGAKYPQLVAAQWALESGWGKSPSGTNNFFGIKAAAGESSTSKQTWEVYGGKEVTTSANFKNYASPQGSVNDLVGKWHKDYKSYKGVNNASDAFSAADMLRQQGYATDPAYSEKLKKIMRDQGY
jgi:flagellum-specific peptidoglycan hydrolase FlgJ